METFTERAGGNARILESLVCLKTDVLCYKRNGQDNSPSPQRPWDVSRYKIDL